MQWTEQAIKACLDGTFTVASYYGKVTTYSVPEADIVPEYKMRPAPASGYKHVYKRKYWTPDQDQQMIDLRAQGWSYKAIGDYMGRTGDAIHVRLHRLREA